MQASDREDFRRSAIWALAGAEDKGALDKVFAWSTTGMRIGEIRYLFIYLKEEPVARAALWAYLKANLPAFEKRLSSQGLERVPGILERPCDTASRDDLRDFFGPKTKAFEGTARPLSLAEEKIGYCIALKEAKGAEFVAALRAVVPTENTPTAL